MKQTLLKCLTFSLFTVIAACSTSDGESDKIAEIPGPKGIVSAQNNPNNYCQFGNGTITCHNKISFNGQACSTDTFTFTDTASLCQQIPLLEENSRSKGCNVSLALNELYQQQCKTLAQPGSPTQPIPVIKTLTCEYNAYTPYDVHHPSQATLTIEGDSVQAFDMNHSHLLINPTTFGKVRVVYKPGHGNGADTISVEQLHFNGEFNASQTGFAGQPNTLSINGYDSRSRAEIKCRGSHGFKKNIKNANYKKLVCKGVAKLTRGLGETEIIDRSFRYTDDLAHTDLRLAEGLTVRVKADINGGDNAQIEYIADGVGRQYNVLSTSYLKTASTLKAEKRGRKVEVTCSPR